MNAKLPIIEQLHEARTNRGRADVLLRCPDSIVLKYAAVFVATCQRVGFEAGEAFVQARVSAMLAVRSEAGALPGGLAMQVETLRAELTAFAAGAPVLDPALAESAGFHRRPPPPG